MQKGWGWNQWKEKTLVVVVVVGEGGSPVAFGADFHADSLAAAFQLGWLGAPVTDFLKTQSWAIVPDFHTSGDSSGCQHPLGFRETVKTSEPPR